MRVLVSLVYSLSPIAVIYFVAFSHAALMVAILVKNGWHADVKRPPGLLLSLLLAVMAYKLLEAGLIQSGGFRTVPHLIDLVPGVALLIGPLFLAYVQRMAGDAPWGGLWLLHLAPFVLLLAFQLPGMWLSGAEKVARISTYTSAEQVGALPWRWVLLLLAMKAHLATYLWRSWRCLSDSADDVLATRADDALACVRWQHKLCLMLMGLELFWVVLFLGQQWFAWGTLSAVSDYWLLLMAVIVLLMGYWGLQKPHLIIEGVSFEQAGSKQNEVKTESPTGKTLQEVPEQKYNHSLLDDDTAAVMADSINQTLDESQLYLDSDLNLTLLSEHLGIRKHLVSQVINQTMGTTFFQLINGKRVAHAKAMIDDGRHAFTLERIAIESGFNNRVTFNKAFKDVAGCSPSVYRKSLKMAS